MTNPPHHCHAEACTTSVPPARFMCAKHWYMLPKRMRDRVWEEYVPGQEVDKNPTPEYMLVTTDARMYVAAKEGRTDVVIRLAKTRSMWARLVTN